MANEYCLGQKVTIRGLFKDDGGALADPDVVIAQYRHVSGTATTLTYGVDAELVRDAVGTYHVDVDANADGYWYYRFYSTGTGQAACEGALLIKRSAFL